MGDYSNYSIYSNDLDFDLRLDLVRKLTKETFKFELRQVKPVSYDIGCRFPYNNFVFEIEVNPDTVDGSDLAKQPGVQPIPAGSKKLIVRLPNQVKDSNREKRVENEVAALQLAREALVGVCPVPRVFAWHNGAKGYQGWMLQEMMKGRDLCEDIAEMDDSSRKKILDQMGLALQSLQNLELPTSITSFGGLAFDGTLVVSSQMSTMTSGPFSTYPSLLNAILRNAIQCAEQHHRIKGWRANGLRDRLEAFMDTGLMPFMRNVTMTRKTLVHADFSQGNFLYDPVTLQLTAIIDFDAAYIGTVADEFLYGIGRLPDPGEGEAEAQLSMALFKGFPDPLPQTNKSIRWALVRDWNNILEARSTWRPSNIPGIKELALLSWLEKLIFPGQLRLEYLYTTEEGRDRFKDRTEQQLSEVLQALGF